MEKALEIAMKTHPYMKGIIKEVYDRTKPEEGEDSTHIQILYNVAENGVEGCVDGFAWDIDAYNFYYKYHSEILREIYVTAREINIWAAEFLEDRIRMDYPECDERDVYKFLAGEIVGTNNIELGSLLARHAATSAAWHLFGAYEDGQK